MDLLSLCVCVSRFVFVLVLVVVVVVVVVVAIVAIVTLRVEIATTARVVAMVVKSGRHGSGRRQSIGSRICVCEI